MENVLNVVDEKVVQVIQGWYQKNMKYLHEMGIQKQNIQFNFRSRRESQNYQNSMLEVVLPPDTPTTSMLLLESLSPCPTPNSCHPLHGINLLLSPFEEELVHMSNIGIQRYDWGRCIR